MTKPRTAEEMARAVISDRIFWSDDGEVRRLRAESLQAAVARALHEYAAEVLSEIGDDLKGPWHMSSVVHKVDELLDREREAAKGEK